MSHVDVLPYDLTEQHTDGYGRLLEFSAGGKL
jgi:hypothetical protein